MNIGLKFINNKEHKEHKKYNEIESEHTANESNNHTLKCDSSEEMVQNHKLYLN